MGGSSRKLGGKSTGAKPRGNGAGEDDKCPKRLSAAVTAPAPGISPGAWLEVELDRTTQPNRVVLFDLASRAIVGSLAGIPGLNVLIECLESGVEYRAYVDNVVGGRVDITVVQQ